MAESKVEKEPSVADRRARGAKLASRFKSVETRALLQDFQVWLGLKNELEAEDRKRSETEAQ